MLPQCKHKFKTETFETCQTCISLLHHNFKGKKHFLGIIYLQYNKSNLVLQMPNLHRLRYLHAYVFCNITITILIVMIHAKFDERLSIIIYTCISV